MVDLSHIVRIAGLLLLLVTGLPAPVHALARPAATALAVPPGYPVFGIDVSNHQRGVNWAAVAGAGASFAYAKATEGLHFTDPYFAANNAGAKAWGLAVGAYHFGRPDQGQGRLQADYFMDRNLWLPDGRTLPPMLDIEWPWSGSGAPSPCYGLSPAAMVAWIREFVDEVRARTGRPAMIYTNINWWNPCTGSSRAFADTYLFIARYNTSPGPVPPSWGDWTFWQYSDAGPLPGDQDVYAGTLEQLGVLAGRPPPQAPGGLLGDFDGDHRPDVAGIDSGGDNLYIHRNLSTPGQVVKAPGVLVSRGWSTITDLMTADVDGDGRADIVGRQPATGSLLVWRSTSTPFGFGFAPAQILDTGWNALGTLLPLADYTGDGKPDFAGVDRTGDDLYLHRNTSTPGHPAKAPGVLVSRGWATITGFLAADVDGDARADILGRQPLRDTLIVWRSTSTAGTVSFAPYQTLGSSWNAIGTLLPAADYTGDARPDVAGIDTTTDNLWIHRNTSSPGRVSLAGGVLVSRGWATISTFTAGDLDGDGRADIVARQPAGDALLYWRSTSGPASLAFAPYGSFGRTWNLLPYLISAGPASKPLP